jgi:hypothetical protein
MLEMDAFDEAKDDTKLVSAVKLLVVMLEFVIIMADKLLIVAFDEAKDDTKPVSAVKLLVVMLEFVIIMADKLLIVAFDEVNVYITFDFAVILLVLKSRD